MMSLMCNMILSDERLMDSYACSRGASHSQRNGRAPYVCLCWFDDLIITKRWVYFFIPYHNVKIHKKEEDLIQ